MTSKRTFQSPILSRLAFAVGGFARALRHALGPSLVLLVIAFAVLWLDVDQAADVTQPFGGGAPARLLFRVAAWSVLGTTALVVVAALLLSRPQRWSKRKLLAAIHQMPQGLLLYDEAGNIVFCNDRYISMYRVSPDVVKSGCSLRDLIAHRKETGTFAGDIDQYCALVLGYLKHGREHQVTVQIDDGRSIQITHRPLADGGWVVTHEDITARRGYERKLGKTQRLLDAVIEHMPAILSVKDVLTQRYLIVNRAACGLFGRSRNAMIGKTAHEIFDLEQASYFEAHDRDAIQSGGRPIIHEHTVVNPASGPRVLNTTKLTILDGAGDAEFLVSFSEDITARRRAEASILHMAHYDALTGVANRVLLQSRLEAALASARPDAMLAVLFIDIDHFKNINDTFGHSVGDDLLKIVVERISQCTRRVDMVARLGGDEFVVFLSDLATTADTEIFAARVLRAIAVPIKLDNQLICATVSIGISHAPDDAATPEEILACADLALYAAKRDGRGIYRIFKRKMSSDFKARRDFEIDFRKAVAAREFEVYYQPLLRIHDSTISCCEALLRWNHPERGWISPAQFIPVAEETRLINELGAWVLETACAEAATWPDHIKLAVNVSPVQFKCKTLALKVAAALAKSGLRAGRLELEITEAVLIDDAEGARAVLHQLRALGVRIALDDFGTGYSSLSYLERFPFDKIKIDRSFIAAIAEPGSSQIIVQAIVNIAMALHMTTTAEGVETERQLTTLRALRCTEMQGYLFSPAIPAATVRQLILSTPALLHPPAAAARRSRTSERMHRILGVGHAVRAQFSAHLSACRRSNRSS